MASKNLKLRVSLFLLLLGIVASMPAFAGSAVIGSVAGSMNATIGGQSVLPNTTVFSGDSLRVNDGAAVVAIGNATRMVFGRDTLVSFLRDSDEVTVLLSQGNVSVYHPDEGVPLRVKVGDVSILPAKGFKTLGEVAMAGGTVVITAKEGMLRVEGNGSAQEVAKGKTITVPAKAKTARAPQPGGSTLGGANWVEAGALGAAAVAAVLAGIGISRANDARDAANAANATAGQAVTAANVANATAGAAVSAASTANVNAIATGCALNTVAVASGDVSVSPFTPTGGTAPGC